MTLAEFFAQQPVKYSIGEKFQHRLWGADTILASVDDGTVNFIDTVKGTRFGKAIHLNGSSPYHIPNEYLKPYMDAYGLTFVKSRPLLAVGMKFNFAGSEHNHTLILGHDGKVYLLCDDNITYWNHGLLVNNYSNISEQEAKQLFGDLTKWSLVD